VPRPVRTDQVARASTTLARAFADDLMVRWPMPRTADELTLTEYFARTLAGYVDLGVAWQVGDCAAVAAWFPPAEPDELDAVNARTRDAVIALTDDAGARFDRLWSWVEAQLPEGPFWFLDFIGVDPAAQGQGLGRVLIELGLAWARAGACPAVLETATVRNVTYYERFGFRVRQVGDPPGGGPRIWFMICEG
jgi:GNAT superfamily N-acetyltransferase